MEDGVRLHPGRKAMDEGRPYRRVEVTAGRRRRRSYTAQEKAQEKARIVAESAAPVASISEVARRNGVNRGLPTVWRREAGVVAAAPRCRRRCSSRSHWPRKRRPLPQGIAARQRRRGRRGASKRTGAAGGWCSKAPSILASLIQSARLNGVALQRLAAQQARDRRHLAGRGEALRRAGVRARGGAGASVVGALRRPPGLRPCSLSMSTPPVVVQSTAAGCLIEPCRAPHPDESEHTAFQAL